MKLTLPFPTTVNTYWRKTNRGVLISASGRSFRSNAYAAILEQLRCAPQPITENVQVHLVLHPPTRQRRDLDNYQKVPFDSLTLAKVYEVIIGRLDDSRLNGKAGKKQLITEPYKESY